MRGTTGEQGRVVRDALAALEVDDLLLGIHGPSFPGGDADDTGVGSPPSDAGRRFLAFVCGLGFTGIQLGPAGETSETNPSPYDGTLFSRSRLTISLGRLAAGGLLPPATLERLTAARPPSPPDRIAQRDAHRIHRAALGEAYAEFVAGGRDDRRRRLAEFQIRNGWWLDGDALYEALAVEHGDDAWDEVDARLPDPPPGRQALFDARRAAIFATHAATIERYAVEQLIAHEQHDAVRAVARDLGLELWGDLQIGFSARDRWTHQKLILSDYAMGAPPSRTNPEGQPWGYPVLDPRQPRPVAHFVRTRLDKTFAEFDGVRLDHPHGWVCPWVYRTGTDDPLRAVQSGARLFDSPDLADHPSLAALAIAGRADLNPDRRTPRHADDWVVTLTAEQLDRYDALMAIAVAAARRHGKTPAALACEVLSTCPYPLRRVLERHGLGRFRITQKANLREPADVYRSENAAPADWVMLGTHDTKPVWRLLEDWSRDPGARAEYLAWRLAPPGGREHLARALVASPELLAHAQFADLFASRARHVMIFFTDLFGLTDVYNQGGVVAEDNWTLRLAPDYRERHTERAAAGRALDLPLALLLALRARGSAAPDDLVRRLAGLTGTLACRFGVPW